VDARAAMMWTAAQGETGAAAGAETTREGRMAAIVSKVSISIRGGDTGVFCSE
jgi:hypothetical protein